jgi:hypothetical protein
MRNDGLRACACAALLAVASACGGAADSPLLGDGGGGGGDGGGGDAAPDGAGCDFARCPSVPDGFTFVRLGDGKAGCPSGWSGTDVVWNPSASDGACTCACAVGTQPSCDTGDIVRSYDQTSTPTCNVPGQLLQANQGGCSSTGVGLDLNRAHYQVDPAPASGGACTYTAQVDTSKIAASPGSLCAPPSSCPGAACDGNACIAHDGDVACPAGFSTKTLVGTSATADCSDCGACAVSGVCTGKMKFFTDTQCTQGEADFTADGVCKANTVSSASYFYSYSYTGSLASATCAPATSTATARLDGQKTVCCP